MGTCELLINCPFFDDHLKNMPTASDMMKSIYCRWDFKKCARYKVASVTGSIEVPSDLFPGDLFRAREILIQYHKK